MNKKRPLINRKSYTKLSKRELRRHSGYCKANQLKRARKSTKKIRNYLGRVIRDIERKTVGKISSKMKELLEIGKKLFVQRKEDKEKIYSVHEPQVECIAKGKVHKI